jgi:hypothetical protein
MIAVVIPDAKPVVGLVFLLKISRGERVSRLEILSLFPAKSFKERSFTAGSCRWSGGRPSWSSREDQIIPA